jgi:X-X-X-Leu-X-X-Gly heptad repeat protein
VSRQLDLSRIGPRVVLATAIASVVGLAALLGRVGSDAQWLAALGHVIAHRGAIPAGVPFAAAPTGNWPNALVLAELIFGGLESALGDRGLMLAQLLAVAGALAILARDARAGGAQAIGTGAALLLAGVGGLPSLSIARVQLFSLLLFPALVALLRSQSRTPSRRIWLAVPLLALWSNLHGAALLGLGVLFAYLLLERARRQPALAGAVAAASAAAICLTPALARTVDYYQGVVTNEAAQRGAGMWGALSFTSPLDLVLVLAAVVLLARAWKARTPRWEWCVVAVLVLLTVRAERNGIWLLFFAAVPAARALAPTRSLRALVPVLAVASVMALGFAVARGPVAGGAPASLVNGAVALADGSPVLADGSVDEQVALAGGRIWAGNPIDAFSPAVQSEYLDWLAGSPSGAGAVADSVRVVLVARGSRTAALMAHLPGFVAAPGGGRTVLYERRAGVL